VLSGGACVAVLKLHSLAGLWQSRDGKRAGLLFIAQEVPDQEVSHAVLVAVFVHGKTDEQVGLCAAACLFVEPAQRIGQHFDGRPPRDRLDQVVPDARDNPWLTDWQAALRDRDMDTRIASYCNCHRAIRVGDSI